MNSYGPLLPALTLWSLVFLRKALGKRRIPVSAILWTSMAIGRRMKIRTIRNYRVSNYVVYSRVEQ